MSEEDFCQYLVSKYSLKPPNIYEDKIYVYSPQEVDIDVSKDPMRANFNRSRPFYVKGVQVIIAVPFEGDGELFQYKPSTFFFNPPRGEVRGEEIHLIYEMAEHNAERLKQEYQRDLNRIKKYLEWVRRDVESFNSSLEPLLGSLYLKEKRSSLMILV